MLAFCWVASTAAAVDIATETDGLQVGFASVDITPSVDDQDSPVWLAGYGWGRKATGVHDPIFARTLVLGDGMRRVAIVSVDLVGLQLPEVRRVRAGLSDFDYVVVSSTHNHEAPDTIGIWGRSPVHRGVDDAYLTWVVDQVVASVREAATRMRPARGAYGTAVNEALLGDSRLPVAKDGVLRVLRFDAPGGPTPVGVLVQWNCHPEALGSKNTLVTADFCAATVAKLQETFRCPVVYVTGAVGGLMAPPDDVLKDANGQPLREGEYAFAQAYGEAVAQLAGQAIQNAQPIDLAPFQVAAAPVAVPIDNTLYRTAQLFGVLRREAIAWTGDFHQTNQPATVGKTTRYAACSEVACLRFGELYVACIPGEIYPELVYGGFQEPVETNVDYPDAPLEPTVQQLIPGDKWMLLGLANDEIGYILPRRQWDQKPPFAYGRTRSQYGEINSCSDQAGPIIMKALAEQVAAIKASR